MNFTPCSISYCFCLPSLVCWAYQTQVPFLCFAFFLHGLDYVPSYAVFPGFKRLFIVWIVFFDSSAANTCSTWSIAEEHISINGFLCSLKFRGMLRQMSWSMIFGGLSHMASRERHNDRQGSVPFRSLLTAS